jgi:GT2 family glycosyltransferase
VLHDPAPFNFARLNNLAARHATGGVLCFLNDDTRVIAPDWIEEMTALALQPDVGIVGARLLYGDGTIQHAGVLLGAFTLTQHLLQGRPADFRGYHNRGLLTHAVSAVTAACAVTRRDLFEALGGFDEQLPAAYNDVDLCLRRPCARALQPRDQPAARPSFRVGIARLLPAARAGGGGPRRAPLPRG